MSVLTTKNEFVSLFKGGAVEKKLRHKAPNIWPREEFLIVKLGDFHHEGLAPLVEN